MRELSITKRLEQGESVDDLVKLALNGDEAFLRQLLKESGTKDAAKLKPLIRRTAESPRIRDVLGSIAHQAEASWIAMYARDEFSKEATDNKLRLMKKELEGDSPTPLEKLLVHRIIVCWLQLHYVETKLAQRLEEGLSSETIKLYQKWLDRAQKRYLAAIKMLAVIRKLGVPAIQVNIGEKQVNVAGDGERRVTRPG